MLIILLLKAFLLGVVVTAPVGPVGALVIRRTLRSGIALGIFTGLGAALADSFFSGLAAFGMSTVQEFILRYKQSFALSGGVILLVIGIVSVRKSLKERDQESLDLKGHSTEVEEPMSALRALKAASGSALITFSNPVTILGFAGAFAAFGLWNGHAHAPVWTTFEIVAGVFCGAMSWWTGLSMVLHSFRKRLSKSTIFFIHMCTNGILFLSAILCLMRGARA